MTTELQFLATSVVLGLLSLIATSHLISFQRGYRWSASERDETYASAARSGELSRSSYDQFPRNISIFCRVSHPRTYHKLPQCTHDLGSSSILLGSVRLSAHCRPWVWVVALDGILEYRLGRYRLVPDRAVFGSGWLTFLFVY